MFVNVFDKPKTMKLASIVEARTEGRWREAEKQKVGKNPTVFPLSVIRQRLENGVEEENPVADNEEEGAVFPHLGIPPCPYPRMTDANLHCLTDCASRLVPFPSQSCFRSC